jgi:hypothetical protein
MWGPSGFPRALIYPSPKSVSTRAVQAAVPFAAIEAVVPWESFSASVKEAAELV